MSKLRILIGFTLILTLILLPTAAFAKSFDNPNTLDPIYSGTNLTINKSKVSVNQTVRVKLTLKQGGKKAPGVAANLNIVKKSDGSTVADLPGVTSPSGKVVWKFKIRDYVPTAVAGDTFTLTVSITDISGNVIIGSTDVIVR